MGVQAIPIPIEVVSYFSSQFHVTFPFSWDSHGIHISIPNPIPMHISSLYVYACIARCACV